MCRGDTRNTFSKTQLLSRRSCHDTVNFCKLGLPPTRMRAGWSVWSKKRPWTVNRVPPMMLPLDGETPVTSGQGTNILLLNNALNKVQVHYHSEQTSLHLTYLHKSGSWRAFPNPKPWIISSLVNSLKCIYINIITVIVTLTACATKNCFFFICTSWICADVQLWFPACCFLLCFKCNRKVNV